MIIDAHQHLVTGSQLSQYQAFLINGRGFHGKGHSGVTADVVGSWRAAGKTHSQLLDEVGTDMAFLSPRPYSLMHSEKPDKIVHWFCEANNDAIALAVANEPNRFRGIAGLPQCDGSPITDTFEEIDRCIEDLGFIGIMINPDPSTPELHVAGNKLGTTHQPTATYLCCMVKNPRSKFMSNALWCCQFYVSLRAMIHASSHQTHAC